MEEEVIQTKGDLVSSYIFSSFMIVSIIFILSASAIVFNPEGIVDSDIRFGVTLGFIAFIFVMVSMLMRSLENLIDAIYELKEGNYK